MVTFSRVFSDSNYDSDVFWEFVTELIAGSFGSLQWSQKVDIMKAFSRARRGSDELWEYFLKHSLIDQSVDPIERDIALVSFIAEVDLPKDKIPSSTLDISSLASTITNALNQGKIIKANSVACENLAFLAVIHPWATADEAQTFENILKACLPYATPSSMRRVQSIYDRAVKAGSLKTEGVLHIIAERTHNI